MGTLYDTVKAKKTLGASVGGGSLYERAQQNAGIQPQVSTPTLESGIETPGFFARTKDSLKGLFKGEVRIRDVVREMPASTVKVGDAIADTLVPAITNF